MAGVACADMDGIVFPSEAWVADWTSRCNTSDTYRAAARGWDGVVGLEISEGGDGFLSRPLYIRLCAEDGCWSSCELGADPALAENATFRLKAPYLTWKRLVRQELEPLTAIITGRVRVEGRLSELLTWTESLRVMTRLAGQVNTTFGDEASDA